MTSPSDAATLDRMPGVLPLFPLSGALLLPRGQLPLNIFEPRYLQMIDDAFRAHRMIGMIQPDPAGGDERPVPPLFKVGCAGRITQFAESGDGRYIVTLTGVSPFAIVEQVSTVAPHAPNCAVIPSVVWFPAQAQPDGSIWLRRKARLTLPDEPASRLVLGVRGGTRCSVELAPDFLSVAWRKLLQNAAAGLMVGRTISLGKGV